MDSDSPPAERVIGRYRLCSELAAGGMASVHLGKLVGPAGFSRTVAIKRLHPPFAKDPEFVSMFLDEARLAARIRHPNVVSVFDVVARDGELFLVMDYIHGDSLARLLRIADSQGTLVPANIAIGIMAGVLRGLHAAHEALSERGEPLEIVHRDVSPHNILVGTDGIGSVVDFGVAKATSRSQTTRNGQLKGKLSYMAPEQLRLEPVDRRSDVYSASVVLWEALTGKRMFSSETPGGVLASILAGKIQPPSARRSELCAELDPLVMRGLSSQPAERYATAREMATALERAVAPASPAEIGDWVEQLAADTLRARAQQLASVDEDAGAAILESPIGPLSERAATEETTRVDGRPSGLAENLAQGGSWDSPGPASRAFGVKLSLSPAAGGRRVLAPLTRSITGRFAAGWLMLPGLVVLGIAIAWVLQGYANRSALVQIPASCSPAASFPHASRPAAGDFDVSSAMLAMPVSPPSASVGSAEHTRAHVASSGIPGRRPGPGGGLRFENLTRQ